MPCYLFTWHAYGTWMPDRPQGYVRDKQILPTDKQAAASYRSRQVEETSHFDPDTQILLIEELKVTSEHRRFRLHAVATEPTHVHVLVSWHDERPFESLRRGIRESLTRRLNRRVEFVILDY